jgi:hypothetical protein
MTLVLIANIALSAFVLTAILVVASWAIVRSHHEGRPVTAAAGRQWRRNTISLKRGHAPARRELVRPFAS